jgi:hypothetical protein
MRSIPPFTGDAELDAWNQEVAQYLINQPPVPLYNQGTGIITDPVDNSIVGFMQRYLHVRYADDRIGTNFSDDPVGRLFYGVHNADTSVESTDPIDYTWFEVAGGFGGSDKLWFRNLGGRACDLYIGTLPPNYKWSEVTHPAIDLDDLLGVGVVGTDELADRSVTTIKIALGAVTDDELADNAVTKAKMADNAVGLDELDTTGTPDSTKILNGAMAWVELPSTGPFLTQTIVDNGYDISVAQDNLNGHHYVLTSADSDVVGVITDDTIPIGSTLQLVNLSTQGAYITYEYGSIFLINDGTEEITLGVPTGKMARLLKVETTRWIADGVGLSTSAIDMTLFDGVIITEIDEGFRGEDGSYIALEPTGLLLEDGFGLLTEDLFTLTR